MQASPINPMRAALFTPKMPGMSRRAFLSASGSLAPLVGEGVPAGSVLTGAPSRPMPRLRRAEKRRIISDAGIRRNRRAKDRAALDAVHAASNDADRLQALIDWRMQTGLGESAIHRMVAPQIAEIEAKEARIRARMQPARSGGVAR